MRIFCLTRVESSLVGSVHTDSSRMSPSSSDRGSYFTIRSSRFMVASTFLAFVQPRYFCGDFSFPLRAMKLYSTYWLVGNGCRLFAQMYAALRMFYGFFVRLCTAFAYVYGFFISLCTAFAHVARLLRTYTAYLLSKFCGFCISIRIFVRVERIWFVESLDDPILRVLWYVESLNDLILRVFWFFAIFRANARDSLKVSMIWYWWFLWDIFPRKLFVMIGLSGGSNIYGSVELFIPISC